MTADKLPTITITEPALRAFRAAQEDEGAEADHVLRLSIDNRFQNDLYFGPREEGDLVVTSSGLTIAMDAGTARRANGLSIDYVEGRGGTGFKLENPNQNPPVKGIRPADLLKLLEARDKLELIDVRGKDERKKASIDWARALDEAYEAELLAMPKTTKLVFMAHHGRGGQEAAQRFFDAGFTNTWYVVGGIDAWSTWDPNVPRY